MKAQKHPPNMDMNHEMRKAFHKWALEEFAKEPDEQERSRDRRAVRARFNLEKQRRAGSTQMWELLSYAGRVTEKDVKSLFEKLAASRAEAQSAVGQCDQVKKQRAQEAKRALRRAMSLQRRLEQKKVHIKHCHPCDRQLLRNLRNGSLLRTVNQCVMEMGRGRLRGSRPGDYVDVGANQEFSAAAEVLDGPQKRPCTDRFKH